MIQLPGLPTNVRESDMPAVHFFYQQEQAPVKKWFSVIRPIDKEYPEFGPKGIAFHSDKFGLEAWMVTHSKCGKVRQYFPAIDHLVLQPFAWLTRSLDSEIPAVEHLQEDDNWVLFPLNAIFRLGQGPEGKVDADNLQLLSQATFTVDKKGQFPTVVIRQNMSFPSLRHRASDQMFVLVLFFTEARVFPSSCSLFNSTEVSTV